MKSMTTEINEKKMKINKKKIWLPYCMYWKFDDNSGDDDIQHSSSSYIKSYEAKK